MPVDAGQNTRVAIPRRNVVKLLCSAMCAAVARPQPSRGTESITGMRERWLSFTVPDDRHIVVPARFNGVASEAIIDSAAGSVALSTAFAARLGLNTVGSVLSSGIEKWSLGNRVQGPTISIGDVTIRPSYADALDFDAISAVTGRPIAAVIGRDLFDKYVVDIDFSQNRIAFRNGTLSDFRLPSVRLALTQLGNGSRSIPISIEGRAPIGAVFDLGSDTPLHLSAEYVNQQNLLKGKRQSSSMNVGAAGQELNKVAVARRLEVGGCNFRDVPIEIPQYWIAPVPAVIGLPVLRRFRLIIDFKAGGVDMLPDKPALGQPFLKERSGMSVARVGDALQIIYVAPKSPAERVGLQVGDTVVAVNGDRLDSAYFTTHRHEGSKPAGTVLYLTLQNGKTVKLSLADYY